MKSVSKNVEDNGSQVCSPFTLIDSITICQILVICIKNIYTWNPPSGRLGDNFNMPWGTLNFHLPLGVDQRNWEVKIIHTFGGGTKIKVY